MLQHCDVSNRLQSALVEALSQRASVHRRHAGWTEPDGDAASLPRLCLLKGRRSGNQFSSPALDKGQQFIQFLDERCFASPGVLHPTAPTGIALLLPDADDEGVSADKGMPADRRVPGRRRILWGCALIHCAGLFHNRRHPSGCSRLWLHPADRPSPGRWITPAAHSPGPQQSWLRAWRQQ